MKQKRIGLFILFVVVVCIIIVAVIKLGGNKKTLTDPKPTSTPTSATARPTDVKQEENLDVMDPTIQKLYSYVNDSDNRLLTSHYFLEHEEVEAQKMSDALIHYYAFSLLDETDIVFSTKNQTIYQYPFTISKESYEKAIHKLFGSSVTPSRNSNYQFTPVKKFSDTKIGTLEFSYDDKQEQYQGISKIGFGITGSPLFNTYQRLVKATKKGDKLSLEAKFIYVDSAIEENKSENKMQYTYRVYQDAAKKKLLAEKKGQSETEITELNNYFPIEDYLEQAGTIVYQFQEGSDGEYHFVKSKITTS